jgi:hypothetical protein
MRPQATAVLAQQQRIHQMKRIADDVRDVRLLADAKQQL